MHVLNQIDIELDRLVAFSFLRHIATRTDQCDGVSRHVADHLSNRIQVTDRPVGSRDAFGVLERPAAFDGAPHACLNARAIVRVQLFEEESEVDRAKLRLETVDPVKLVGPCERSAPQVPFPAAGVCDLLSYCQLMLQLSVGISDFVTGRRRAGRVLVAHKPPPTQEPITKHSWRREATLERRSSSGRPPAGYSVRAAP